VDWVQIAWLGFLWQRWNGLGTQVEAISIGMAFGVCLCGRVISLSSQRYQEEATHLYSSSFILCMLCMLCTLCMLGSAHQSGLLAAVTYKSTCCGKGVSVSKPVATSRRKEGCAVGCAFKQVACGRQKY
jgi:hypothetical protein